MTGIDREPRAYPLPPEPDDRFTYGLLRDLADVLVRHGYPEITAADWAAFHRALFRFLYAPEPTPHVIHNARGHH